MLPRKTPGFAIQERDIAILRALVESRVMSLRHIAPLFFSGREHAARKRLQKLRSAGLIAERPRKTFDRAVFHLTKAAFQLLAERGLLKPYPRFSLSAHAERARVSDITIRHELEVMDVKAAFCAAAAKSDGVAIAEFITWPQLIQFECALSGDPFVVKPDGFIRIAAPADRQPLARAFYVELDRSTENLATLVHRARSYVAHFKSGGFAVQNGARCSDFREHPFRALFILKSAERRNNVTEALLQTNPPIVSQVWLATLDDVKRDPLGAIWIRPADYRTAFGSAPQTVNRSRPVREYRRSRARDAFAEAHAPKRRLLD